MERLIHFFYIIFQGILLFQVAFFIITFFISKRKEALYYAILNFVSALYFFLNAPDTFWGIDANIVFNSPAYLYVNFALLLLMFFMYLVFLKEIFSDTIEKYLYVKKIYLFTCFAIPILYLLFFVFTSMGWQTNLIFYTGHLINGPFCTVLLLLNYREKGYKSLIKYGMIIVFICALITIILTIRYNARLHSSVFDKYPLAIIRVGMLIDIILFQMALLKRWSEQEKQLVIEKLETQLAVEKVRNQISKELHDDIGSTLSGISMYSHMAKQQSTEGNKTTSGKTLDLIQQASDEMIYKLKDMVWAMQPGNESLGQLTEKIKEYAVFITGAKKIGLQTNFTTEAGGVKLSAEIKHHLYTIAKEALNNAVKYSGATLITIGTSFNDNLFTICIIDNGVGFDKQRTTEGNGMLNMQTRANEMGAALQLITSPGNGTELQLELKITQQGIV